MMSQKYIYPSLFQEEEPQESVPGDKKEYDLTNLLRDWQSLIFAAGSICPSKTGSM